MHDFPVTGRGIHHLAAACGNSNVPFGRGHLEHEYVALLDVTHRGDLLVFRYAAPGFAGHVALLHAGLIQAPVYEAGAVKAAGPFCAGAIGAAELGKRDLHKAVYRSAA